ncbi:polycomb group protein embryonic flower 2 isoform X2 [Tanacetum coccineum]
MTHQAATQVAYKHLYSFPWPPSLLHHLLVAEHLMARSGTDLKMAKLLASAAICQKWECYRLVSRATVIVNKVKTLTITTFLFPSKKVLRATTSPEYQALLQKCHFFYSHRAQPMALEQVMVEEYREDEVDDDVADLEDRRVWHLHQGVLVQDEVMLDTVCAEMQVVKKIKKTLSLQQDIMLSSPLTMVSKPLLKYYQSTLMDLLM